MKEIYSWSGGYKALIKGTLCGIDGTAAPCTFKTFYFRYLLISIFDYVSSLFHRTRLKEFINVINETSFSHNNKGLGVCLRASLHGFRSEGVKTEFENINKILAKLQN